MLHSVPILEALQRADARFAEAWWHWFFFASDQAERANTADPLAWYQPDPAEMGHENYEDTVAAVSDPRTVRAMLEDYRAALHVDRAADETGPGHGRRITCPTLVAWSSQDDLELRQTIRGISVRPGSGRHERATDRPTGYVTG